VLTTTAAARLRRQLADLPELYTWAHLSLAPGSGPAGPRVTGATRTPPLPLRLDVLSLLGPGDYVDRATPGTETDQHGPMPAAAVLSAWCQVFSGQPCRHLTTAVDFLLRVHDDACRHALAADYADDIADLHHQLARHAHTRPRRRPMQLPCPRCELLTLVRQDGRDVECTNPGCRALLEPADYDRRAEQMLDELEAA
jgi:hypothetical protein